MGEGGEEITLQLTDKALAEVELAFASVEVLEKVLNESEKAGYLTEEQKPDGRREQVFRLICLEQGFALKAVPQPPDRLRQKPYYLVVDLWFPNKKDAYTAWAHPLEAPVKLLKPQKPEKPRKRVCRICGRELAKEDRYCDKCRTRVGPSEFGLLFHANVYEKFMANKQTLDEPLKFIGRACVWPPGEPVKLNNGCRIFFIKAKEGQAVSWMELDRLNAALRKAGVGYVMPKDEYDLAKARYAWRKWN